MNIIIFGAQGSGKSTVGKYIAEKLNIPFIATGDIFRELRGKDSNLGRSVRRLYDAGNMIPDDLTMEIVNKRINEKDAEGGFVLDGAPRNLSQEKLLNREPDLLIMVILGKNEAIKRLLDRGRIDDTPEVIRTRLGWYKEKVKPVINYYRQKGVRLIKIDNTPPEDTVKENLDDLLKELKRN